MYSATKRSSREILHEDSAQQEKQERTLHNNLLMLITLYLGLPKHDQRRNSNTTSSSDIPYSSSHTGNTASYSAGATHTRSMGATTHSNTYPALHDTYSDDTSAHGNNRQYT